MSGQCSVASPSGLERKWIKSAGVDAAPSVRTVFKVEGEVGEVGFERAAQVPRRPKEFDEGGNVRA